jgi:F-type H+-transporting ATPase subunit a
MNNWISFERAIAGIEPEFIFSIGSFPIANSTFLLFVGAIVLFVVTFFTHRSFVLFPNKSQSFLEIVYETLVEFIDKVVGDTALSRKIFPLLGSLFVFITLSNLIGLIPGVANITYEGTAIFRTPTADFNTTFALALGAMAVIQYASIKTWGLWGYINRFIKIEDLVKGFKKGFGSGMMAVVDFFIGILDIIGEVAKVFSLSLRLFGNMYAGEVLAVILLGAFAYIIPSLWLAMNILQAFIQALVFGTLVVVFYMLALKPASATEQEGSRTA